MIIKNGDQRSQDYGEIKDRFRPGHADFTYQQNMESAITVAVGVRQRVKQRCELLRGYCKNIYANILALRCEVFKPNR